MNCVIRGRSRGPGNLTRAAVGPFLPDAFPGCDLEYATGLLDQWADSRTDEARGADQGLLSRVAAGWVRALAAEDVPEFPRVIAQRLGFTCPPGGRWRPVDPRHPDRRVAERAIRVGPPERICSLIRDVFGNPFRPVTVDPRWLTSDVLALARSLYDERAFDRMPILADALQDAGCTDEKVLAHCRGEGPHCRGCWVVDLLLGKS